MATTVALRKMLDLKRWEVCNPYPAAAIYSTGVSSTLADGLQYWLNTTTLGTFCSYNPQEDAFVPLPACPITANATAIFHPSGPTGTASAGTATTITTTVTTVGSLAGYTIRITAGTGAGQERVIASNTYGVNAVITVTSPWGTNPDNTSVYLLLTGRVWVLNINTTPALRYYEVATNTWSGALSVSGYSGFSFYPSTLAATPAYGNTIASGTATAGSATTLTNSGKAWATNQWANYQVRITAGTGAGKVATITSNTATVLSFASVTTVLDNTSQYVIEPNDDFLYVTGGNVVTLFRYSIAGNSWSTLSPGTARTSATPANAPMLSWIGVVSDSAWADETNIKNGRYLYSFCSTLGNLSYYDIAANTWVNVLAAYQHGGVSSVGVASTLLNSLLSPVTFTVDREFIYIANVGTATAGTTFWRFNVVTQSLDGFTFHPTSAQISSNQSQIGLITVSSFTDGGTTLRWLYFVCPINGTYGVFGGNATFLPFYRMLII